MKVVLITGSYPPDVCGVADYTERLAEALETLGVRVDVFSGKRWNATSAASLSRELRKANADILHMQYPATGYGRGLGPQMLSMLRRCVITIHECSHTHVLRRLSLAPFFIRPRKLLFTNEFEREYALRFAPWTRYHSAVIPIGSNILPGDCRVVRLPNMVTHFGLIRPQKGLGDVLQMAHLFKQRASGLRVRIVGTVLPGCQSYYAQLREASKDLPVEWLLDLNELRLSKALREAEVAYLPFPDGASERRSSLIGMLVNGTAIITTRGRHSPHAMENAVQFANCPAKAVEIAEKLFKDRRLLQGSQLAAAAYGRKFSWDAIAIQHVTIYEELVALSRLPGPNI